MYKADIGRLGGDVYFQQNKASFHRWKDVLQITT